MQFDFLLVFVDQENAIANADNNNQRRNNSRKNRDFIMEKAQSSERPNHTQKQNANRNECGAKRTEKQKENKRSDKQGGTNKECDFTFHVLGIYRSDVRHA